MTCGWVNCRVGDFSLEATWEVPPGQVLVLFGPSGAGKTTTLRAIAGLVQPEAGHIEVGSRVVYDSAARVWVSFRFYPTRPPRRPPWERCWA